MYRKSYSSSLFLLWRKEVPSPLDLQRASGVISFVFVTLVLCWVKLRPYSEYFFTSQSVIYCIRGWMSKVSNFFDFAPCVLLKSLSPILFSVLLPKDLRPMYNNYCTSTTTVQQRSEHSRAKINFTDGWLLHCGIVHCGIVHSVRVGVNQPLTLYSALNIEF